jgi:hypothetical protein
LGQTRNITRIAIQGRHNQNEYVSEFRISYGYNGLVYADFKEPGGNTKVIYYVYYEATWCSLNKKDDDLLSLVFV